MIENDKLRESMKRDIELINSVEDRKSTYLRTLKKDIDLYRPWRVPSEKKKLRDTLSNMTEDEAKATCLNIRTIILKCLT